MNTGERFISYSSRYNHLFERTRGNFITVKENATVHDTIRLMRDVIEKRYQDTAKIATFLRGPTPMDSLRNIWNFCFKNFQYKKDDDGFEQVRRPFRSFMDREVGIDCDCFTVLVCSMLKFLKINFLIRLTNYKKKNKWEETDEFEHVYPVALVGNKEVIMDCVVHQFNYEVPYKTKMDVTMKLQYLDGIAGEGFGSDPSDNLGDLMVDGFSSEELGMIFGYPDEDDQILGLEGKAERKAKRAEKKEVRKATPLKEKVKKGLHVINRVNPATALLRAGVLASMRLNMMNVAGKLRFAYWPKDLALKNNMEPAKYDQLVLILKKLEQIFYGAGGKPQNLKEAILTGKGNKNRRVALNGVGDLEAVNDEQDLEGMIGSMIYSDEFAEFTSPGSVNGLGSLGEVTAAAAITAASGAMATIAAFLKKLGSLFKKGTPQNNEETAQEQEAELESKTGNINIDKMVDLVNKTKGIIPPDKTLPVKKPGTLPSVTTPEAEKFSGDPVVADEGSFPSSDTMRAMMTLDPNAGEAQKSEAGDGKTEENKAIKWIKENPIPATAIGIATLGGAFLVYKLIKGKKKAAINGLDGTKKSKKGKKQGKKTPSPFRKVELK